MGDMYDKMSVYASASSITQPVSSSSDEMSLLLQQILVRSSGSVTGLFGSDSSPVVADGISAVDSSSAYLSAIPSRAIGRNVEPSGNENDEYDCESEEGLEVLIEEMQAKSANGRASTKRTRAAEVHNMSEKRRRSRINEKMKALQNLIPNSNKTDKASMLDEAIEYLKQLQLQVQMLAMRNGLSLYPVSLPRGLHPPAQLTQATMEFGDENRSLLPNLPSVFPAHQQTASTQNFYSLPNQCTSSNHQLLSTVMSTGISDTTVGLEPSTLTRVDAFQQQPSDPDICKENRSVNRQTNANNSNASHLGFGMEATASLTPVYTQAHNTKDNGSLETCVAEGDWSENLLLKAIEQSMTTGRIASRGDIKIGKINQ